MHVYKQIVIALLLICMAPCAGAQVGNYPVSINPVLYPPYPSSVKSLYASAVPSLVLTITDKSLSTLMVRARLAVSIQTPLFYAQSKPVTTGLAPITLTSGVPLRLTNADIAQAFAFNNLTGITLAQYEGSLPQQRVTFGFVLYDAVTGKQLSAKATYSITYSISQPPYTVVPADRGLVKDDAIQLVRFQWQARQGASIGAVKYIFQLIELLDSTQNPQGAFLTNKPIYTDSTFINNLTYGADKPLLIPNKFYAWRVQAKANDNGNFDAANFASNGYSNVASFKYYTNCKAPTTPLAGDIDMESATISWTSLPEYNNFVFSYRNSGAAKWNDIKVVNTSEGLYYLSNLLGNVTYEIKVTAQCANGFTGSSSVGTFITKQSGTANPKRKKINASCGQLPALPKAATDMLPALNPKDIITTADYSIEVSDVRGQNGIFSGTGLVELWIGKAFQMKVAFSNIKVNKTYQVTDGKITPATN